MYTLLTGIIAGGATLFVYGLLMAVIDYDKLDKKQAVRHVTGAGAALFALLNAVFLLMKL